MFFVSDSCYLRIGCHSCSEVEARLQTHPPAASRPLLDHHDHPSLPPTTTSTLSSPPPPYPSSQSQDGAQHEQDADSMAAPPTQSPTQSHKAEQVRDEAPPPEDLLALTVHSGHHTDTFIYSGVFLYFHYFRSTRCVYCLFRLSNLGGGHLPACCLSFCRTGATEPLY